jgi:hypothetical protein
MVTYGYDNAIILVDGRQSSAGRSLASMFNNNINSLRTSRSLRTMGPRATTGG